MLGVVAPSDYHRIAAPRRVRISAALRHRVFRSFVEACSCIWLTLPTPAAAPECEDSRGTGCGKRRDI